MEANDPIPDGCTLLDEVIDLVYMATTKDAGDIDSRIKEANSFETRSAAMEDHGKKSATALKVLLEHLNQGRIRAYVREPGTGILLQLDTRDWGSEPAYVADGNLWRLFIRPPSSFIGGAWRSIFFKDNDVRSFFASEYPSFELERRPAPVFQQQVTAVPLRQLPPRPTRGPSKIKAWDAISKVFPDGVPATMSDQEVADFLMAKIIEETPSLEAALKKIPPFSRETIGRVLSGK